VSLITLLVLLTLAVLPPPASAWNIPGHMLSGAIAYQVLQQENPQTIDKVKAVLEKHPGTRTNGRRGCKMFLLPITASHSSCRRPGGTNDKQQHRALWHYINWPFKPDGQP